MSGLPGPFLVLFVALKLTGHIDWPWWWVLSPIWISVLLLVAILAFCFVVALVAERK